MHALPTDLNISPCILTSTGNVQSPDNVQICMLCNIADVVMHACMQGAYPMQYEPGQPHAASSCCLQCNGKEISWLLMQESRQEVISSLRKGASALQACLPCMRAYGGCCMASLMLPCEWMWRDGPKAASCSHCIIPLHSAQMVCNGPSQAKLGRTEPGTPEFYCSFDMQFANALWYLRITWCRAALSEAISCICLFSDACLAQLCTSAYASSR